MFHQRHFAIVSVGAVIALAGCSGADGTPGATAEPAGAQTGARGAPATEAWRETMHLTSAPRGGCFEAAFPSTEWVEVPCAEPPAYRATLPRMVQNREEVVGNGSDYVAEAPSGHVFSSVIGSFPTVKGVTSEKSVGVSAFGNGGILGANEYTVQVNTNFYRSAACGSFANCFAWQQYVLSTNTPVSLTSNGLTNKTEVFIEYWLIDYGSNSRAKCPTGFINGGADEEGPGVDCVQNTPATAIASGQLPITDLADLTMSASVTAGGQDATTITYNGKAYTATVADSYTDISAGWTEAEFNVFGNAGGSRADFNTGASVTVKLAVNDGSSAAPTCIPPSSIAGTTGETNNLTAGACTTTSGSSPSIQFTESD